LVQDNLDINALGLNSDTFADPVNLSELPEQFHGYELPQPGRYVFALPQLLKGVWPDGLWLKVDNGQLQFVKAKFRQGKTTEGDRTAFDGRLTMADGRKLSVDLSNMPLGKMPSKLAFLLGEGLGFGGILNSNAAYVRALAEEKPGAKFAARLVWTATNKDTKKRYSTRPWKSKDGTKEAFAIPRDKSGFLQEFVDADGGVLRCFPDLEDFGQAS
jgi:hypothetical protein